MSKMPTPAGPVICSICGNEIEVEPSGWAGGHNAQPINDGRCCTTCNATVVIPGRIIRLLASDKPYE